MKRIDVLVAGTANPHIPSYLNGTREGASVLNFLAVSDHDAKHLDQARQELREMSQVAFYSDWREMLDAHPEAEAVIIGSDNKHHFEMFKEAVKHKKHIYSMKVISMNEDECKEMLRMAKDYDKVIQIELELHFHPQFQYARKLVKEGELGKIESIYLTNISQSPINYYPDWGDPELSYGKTVPMRPGYRICRGGGLTDHPHPFDLIRWITGHEFKKVFAVSAKNQRDHLRVEDHVAITGELNDGTKIFINPSYSNLEEKATVRRLLWPKCLECNLKITGSEGYYAADYFDKHIYVLGGNYVSPNRLIVGNCRRVKLDEKDSMLGCFYECVRGLRKKPESTLEDGIAAVRVMNAAYKSIYTGEIIYI